MSNLGSRIRTGQTRSLLCGLGSKPRATPHMGRFVIGSCLRFSSGKSAFPFSNRHLIRNMVGRPFLFICSSKFSCLGTNLSEKTSTCTRRLKFTRQLAFLKLQLTLVTVGTYNVFSHQIPKQVGLFEIYFNRNPRKN